MSTRPTRRQIRSNVRLSRVLDPLEHRRAQREQRHRLAGHELRAVDQDLHRRRRDVDGDAALVAEVDEIQRPLLREVGVGDDHLVDPLGREHLGELVEPAERAQAVLGPRRERDVADDLDLRPRPAAERVGDLLDVLARADQQRPPPVAGLLQQPAGDPRVELAQHEM